MGNPTNVVDLSQDAATFASTWSLYVSEKQDKTGHTTTEAQITTHVSRHWANWVDDFLLRVHQAFQGDVSIGEIDVSGDVRAGRVVAGTAPLFGSTGIGTGSGNEATVFGGVVNASNNRMSVVTDTASQTISYNLTSDDGTRNTRCKFFLQDDVMGADGRWGAWLTYGSGGLQPFVIGMVNDEFFRVETDGDVTIPIGDLVVGTPTSTSAVARIQTTDTGTSRLSFGSATDEDKIQILGAPASSQMSWMFSGAQALNLRPTDLHPHVARALNLGLSNLRWNIIWGSSLDVDGNIDVSGPASEVTIGNGTGLVPKLTISGSNAVATIGDGTGTPNLRLDKADTGAAQLQFRNAGDNRFIVELDGFEDFGIERWGGSPATLTDVAFGINRTTGEVSIANDLTLDSGGGTMTVGDGTGAPALVIDADGTATQTLMSLKHAGTTKWDVRTTSSGTFLLRNTGSGGANSLSIGTNDAVGMAGDLTISGGVVDIANDNPVLRIGNGVSGAALELRKADAVTGADLRWMVGSTIRWIGRMNASEDLVFERRNSSGTIVDNPLTFGAVTGNAVLANDLEFTAAGPRVTSGTGTPESAVTAPIGSMYLRTDGGTGTTLYVKESGTGNTGWTAK